MPRFHKHFVSEVQLKAIHRYPASITKGTAARDVAVLHAP